ncbi:hypothetical protein EDD17DRAFT_208685 [Pisolithus thermaeus]|nr:hypothetical protein EDD17DRAFT_208685 [Pisolithus thermaeus]
MQSLLGHVIACMRFASTCIFAAPERVGLRFELPCNADSAGVRSASHSGVCYWPLPKRVRFRIWSGNGGNTLIITGRYWGNDNTPQNEWRNGRRRLGAPSCG